jgi:hypothetical protein
MAFVNTVNDGAVVAGSRQLTINSVVYETNDLKFNYKVNRVVRTDGQGIPNGKRLVLGEVMGSATLQLNLGSSAPATVIPQPLMQFTTVDGVNTTVYCTVEDVGRDETKDGLMTVPITFSVNLSGAANTGSVSTSAATDSAFNPLVTGAF